MKCRICQKTFQGRKTGITRNHQFICNACNYKHFYDSMYYLIDDGNSEHDPERVGLHDDLNETEINFHFEDEKELSF